MDTVKVEYVGLKPSETDHTYGTGLTWTGAGDVQDVPIDAWEKMAKHTDVWRLAEDVPEAKAVSDQEAYTLTTMSDDAMRQFATDRGFKIHHKKTGDNLRWAIREAMQGAAE
jgi:hypothetical protein